MPDTQWPRFMVFQQEVAGQPFVHNGTVHAPDIDLALQNARDVFVRRPEAAALWVVPVESILSRTREELETVSVIARKPNDNKADEAISPNESQTYHVFGKLSEQSQASELGEVMAKSAPDALEAAMAKFLEKPVLRWYVFPAAAVLKSNPADSGPMFAPARDKTFKDQAEYPVATMMRKFRAKGKPKDE